MMKCPPEWIPTGGTDLTGDSVATGETIQLCPPGSAHYDALRIRGRLNLSPFPVQSSSTNHPHPLTELHPYTYIDHTYTEALCAIFPTGTGLRLDRIITNTW